jgi:hypothetical protein
MRPPRLRKTLRQTTRRRRSAFYVLSQAHEPDEDFIDPYARRHDETLASLLRVAHSRRWVDPTQLELWAEPRPAAPTSFVSRRMS